MICSRPDVVRVLLSEYQHFFHVSAILLVANHVCCIAIVTIPILSHCCRGLLQYLSFSDVVRVSMFF